MQSKNNEWTSYTFEQWESKSLKLEPGSEVKFQYKKGQSIPVKILIKSPPLRIRKLNTQMKVIEQHLDELYRIAVSNNS